MISFVPFCTNNFRVDLNICSRTKCHQCLDSSHKWYDLLCHQVYIDWFWILCVIINPEKPAPIVIIFNGRDSTRYRSGMGTQLLGFIVVDKDDYTISIPIIVRRWKICLRFYTIDIFMQKINIKIRNSAELLNTIFLFSKQCQWMVSSICKDF